MVGIVDNDVDQSATRLYYSLAVTHEVESEDALYNHTDTSGGPRIHVAEDDTAGLRILAGSPQTLMEGDRTCYSFGLTTRPTRDVAVVIQATGNILASPPIALIPTVERCESAAGAAAGASPAHHTNSTISAGLESSSLVAVVHTVEQGAWGNMAQVLNHMSNSTVCSLEANATFGTTTIVATVSLPVGLHPTDLDGLAQLRDGLASELGLVVPQLQVIAQGDASAQIFLVVNSPAISLLVRQLFNISRVVATDSRSWVFSDLAVRLSLHSQPVRGYICSAAVGG